jgi:tetratricopeptide (TPR) repeat protein
MSQFSAAHQAFDASMAIAQQLAERDPANAQWQRDLSESWQRMGEVLQAQGDLCAALEAFKKSMAIAHQLAERDPANAQWQRDLSVGWQRIGGALQAQGDIRGALKSYRDSLEIAMTLAERDPSNWGWQNELAAAYWRTGYTWEKAEPGSESEARAMVKKGYNILQQLKKLTGLTTKQQELLDLIDADLRKRASTRRRKDIVVKE